MAPILALFGERITTQFFSQSFTVYDCIVFTACPIGIITAIASVIRVATLKVWKTMIGRGMENQATVELERLSSTSREVCELWSGRNLVKVMGSPGILELVYTPSLDSDSTGQQNPTDCGIFTLKKHKPASVVTSPPGKPCRVSAVSGSERLAGDLLGVSGAIAVRPFFPKNGHAPITAAFPLMATGTVMTSLGMFLCSLVVENATEERLQEFHLARAAKEHGEFWLL